MEHDIGPRIRAARHLAGHKNVAELAAAIQAAGWKRGLGTTSLRNLERGQETAGFGELSQIAHVCEVPVEWFTADFSRLAEISEDPRKVIAAEMAAAAERADARRAGRTSDLPPLREAGQ